MRSAWARQVARASEPSGPAAPDLLLELLEERDDVDLNAAAEPVQAHRRALPRSGIGIIVSGACYGTVRRGTLARCASA